MRVRWRAGMSLVELLLAVALLVSLMLPAWEALGVAVSSGVRAEGSLEAGLHTQALIEGLQDLEPEAWPTLPPDQEVTLMELGGAAGVGSGPAWTRLVEWFREGPARAGPSGESLPLRRLEHRLRARLYPSGSVSLRVELGWRVPGRDDAPPGRLVMFAAASPELRP